MQSYNELFIHIKKTVWLFIYSFIPWLMPVTSGSTWIDMAADEPFFVVCTCELVSSLGRVVLMSFLCDFQILKQEHGLLLISW